MVVVVVYDTRHLSKVKKTMIVTITFTSVLNNIKCQQCNQKVQEHKSAVIFYNTKHKPQLVPLST